MDELTQYAATYDGSFDFMRAMRAAVERGQPLSPGMLASIAKCKAADERRKAGAVLDANGLDLSSMPDGTTRHAVRNSAGDLVFLRVDKVCRETSWKGFIFVKHVVGPNELRVGRQAPGGTYYGIYVGLLGKILHNPYVSMARYGQEIGECGKCGRRLTDDESRERGIGPECRKKIA